ncbi:MAG TPA: aminotransferase class V-fold PLP-dependent enzyme [Nocardioidaceae bacterium]|nr:aminotransferase class V-fold PLP-dependent enzyme [Nocardioidaceae bacterium]
MDAENVDPALDLALDRAHTHARGWLAGLDTRPVPPALDVGAVKQRLGTAIPEGPSDPADVVDLLADAVQPGLTGMPSGRFFGFVIGGTHPAALAADWLVSAWDQNAGMRKVTPAVSAVEETAASWLLDLLGLPVASGVGFTTGATTANFTGLAAGRDEVLRRVGHDVAAEGLAGGPRVRVLVGLERHDSVDVALRYLGLGTPDVVDVDDQGRMVPDALERALGTSQGAPTLVVLQAGNLHSGAFDPFEDCARIAHEHDAWVHVDGAFGLWAAASPSTRPLTTGLADADSWATDAHKTLNVPYDCGVVAVRDVQALHAAMAVHGHYLIVDPTGDPLARTPEMSRRGRGIPVWAVLRSLGRQGVAEMVDRMCTHAQAFAKGIGELEGAEILNDVVFTQVCASFGDDARTQAVVERVLADGTTWMSGSRWQDRAVLRVSVSNWSTTEDDVARSLEALRRALG